VRHAWSIHRTSKWTLQVLGTTKMTVMLGFTLAAFNLDRIRSFRAKHSLDESARPVERPRKTGLAGAAEPGRI